MNGSRLRSGWDRKGTTQVFLWLFLWDSQRQDSPGQVITSCLYLAILRNARHGWHMPTSGLRRRATYSHSKCHGIAGWMRRIPQGNTCQVPRPTPPMGSSHGGAQSSKTTLAAPWAPPHGFSRDLGRTRARWSRSWSPPQGHQRPRAAVTTTGDSASCPQPCRGAGNQQQAVSRWHRHGGHGEEGTEMLVAFGRDGHSRAGSRPGRQLAYG